MTLLQELGGREAVEMVVAAFYDRVLADNRLVHFFRGVQMSRMMRHQTDFFCMALSNGREIYQGRDLKKAHATLQISDDDFDAVAVHLVGALNECGVPKAQIDQVIDLVAPLREQIVTRKVILSEEFNQPLPNLPAPMAWTWAYIGLAVLLALLAGAFMWKSASSTAEGAIGLNAPPVLSRS